MEPTEHHEGGQHCRYCTEAIRARAKVCPHCRQWLSLLSFRHPVVGPAVLLLPVIALMVVIALAGATRLDQVWHPSPFYTAFPGSLRVVESRVSWVEATNGPRLYVTGLLTNQSPVAWKDVEFECRYFNAGGEMVDASNSRGYFTIQPDDDRAFRLVVIPARSSNEYVTHRLAVSTARNIKAVF